MQNQTFKNQTLENKITSLQLKDAPYPKYHRDYRNTGQSPYISYSDGTIKWTYSPGGYSSNVRGSPAIDSDGTIYIGDSGRFYALNPDGTIKWSSEVGGSGWSSPIISSDGTIYNASYFELYAFDPDDGAIKWACETNGYLDTTPAIGIDGTIYVPGTTVDGVAVLYAIDPDGIIKWTYNIEGPEGSGRSRPAIGSDGTIYVKMVEYTPEYAIYLDAINPDGTRLWRTFIGNAGDRQQGPAIASDGTVYIAMGYLEYTYLHAINPTNGSIIWSTEFPGLWGTESSPAIADDGTIYIGVGPYMYAVDPDGNIKWDYLAQSYARSPPMIGGDGTIYFGTNGIWSEYYGVPLARFYALNPNGTLKWYQDISADNSIVSSPSMAPDGTIYVGVDAHWNPDFDNRVVAFQSFPMEACPTALKYKGDTITLRATPRDGTGPYYVEFQKNGDAIPGNDPSGYSYTIENAPEDEQITRTYILTNDDIRTAYEGTINFSVLIRDSCPIPLGPKTCTEICTINIGCIAPVCNFIVS